MNLKVTTAFRMVPMVMVMGTIFFLSHQPGDTLSMPTLPGFDKLAHMLAYGTLAATVLFALCERQKKTKAWRVVLLTLAFCFLYGISDEFHQSFVPGRFVSVYDVIADCLGAAITCALWARWRKRSSLVSCL